ncbi:MAG: hypothetical protein AAF515_12155 [Pseudomonadota bacterium]
MTTLLIVLAGMALVVGPIAYLMPSRRDRELASLRMAARARGLEVELARLPKLNADAHERVSASGIAKQPVLECVEYGLPLPLALQGALSWRALVAPETEFPLTPGLPNLELDRGATPNVPLPPYFAALPEILAALPADTVALGVTRTGVVCYWHERLGGAADSAAGHRPAGAQASGEAILDALAQALRALLAHHAAWLKEAEF